MPMEDFEIQEDLGKGSFGCVVKVIRKSDGQLYAMKQIKLQKLKQKDKKNALNQIRFLASLTHRNLASYRQAFYDQHTQNLCIVMDFANGGDLSKKIKKQIHEKIRIKQQAIWKLAYQVLQGLNKLHQSNIIHRDIKPANVFFHNGSAQIGDLNIAKHLKDPFTVTQTGTPYYASPQVWNQEPYDYKSDIWSFGCVLYEMAALRPPFRGDTPQKLYAKVQSGIYDPLPTVYSKQLSDFIKKLLIVDQKQRPSCKQLLTYEKIIEIKQQSDNILEQHKQQLLKTINFPQNIKHLNDQLPKSNYQINKQSIINSNNFNIIQNLQNINSNSKKSLPINSLKLIPSQKQISNIKDIPPIKKFKILNKNGSQKLIF